MGKTRERKEEPRVGIQVIPSSENTHEEGQVFRYAGLNTHKRIFVVNEIDTAHLHVVRASEMTRRPNQVTGSLMAIGRMRDGLKPLKDMLSYVTAGLGNYKELTDLTSVASDFYIQNKKLDTVKTISRDAERAIADILIKEFFKTSDLLLAAYKVREKGLEYAVILKDDEAEIRGVFSDYIDEAGESLKAIKGVVIHYILPELEEHIVYSEKII